MGARNTVQDAAKLLWEEVDHFVAIRLILTLALIIATSTLAALAPIALKLAIDGLGQAQTLDAHPKLPMTPVALLLLYVSGLWLSRSFGEARWFFFGTADQRLNRRLSRRLLAHVIDLPMAFHLDRKTGALNQTLVQGLAGYRILLNHFVFTLLPVLIELIVIGVVIFTLLSPDFLAILGVSILAYAGVFALGASRIIGPARDVSANQIEAHATMTDSLLNAETVKCFNAEREIENRFDTALFQTEKRWSVFFWRKSENGLLAALVFGLSFGAAMALGALRVQQGAITVGDFVALNAYMLQIVRPLETLGLAFRDIAQGAAFIEKMLALMGRQPERPRAAPPDLTVIENTENVVLPKAGKIEVRDISFAYRPDRPILENLNFTIDPGKTLAVVGPSGAGKSSLVRLLLRFYEPNGGKIFLNGESIATLDLDDVRGAIAVVPQDTVLFNDTIARNIAFGRAGASPAEIERAASFAHIHQRILEMPDGYDTIVGERGLKLSGGEKQRISIARAVLKRPQMFVFDEATSSLDAHTEKAILANLIQISSGMTTLIISHRLSMVTHADEILVLEKGRIIERGVHATMLEQDGAYAAMWRAQSRTNLEMANEVRATA